MGQPARPPGRPRDPDIDEAILRAVRELLLQVGYSDMTFTAVARKAGVSKPALYRRWPNKSGLVFAAVFGRTRSRSDPDTGNLADDLREAYGWVVEEFAAPEAAAALPGLMADLATDPTLAALVRKTIVDPEYERVRIALRRGQERGEVRNDIDLTLVIDAFTGTAFIRATLLDRPVDPDFGDRLVDLLVQGLEPRRSLDDPPSGTVTASSG